MLDDLQAAAQLRAAGDEQLALQGHGRLDSRFVGVRQQFRGPLDLGAAQALGNQARLYAAIIEQLAQGHVQLRLRLHRIELHEQLPLGDAVAIADQQFSTTPPTSDCTALRSPPPPRCRCLPPLGRAAPGRPRAGNHPASGPGIPRHSEPRSRRRCWRWAVSWCCARSAPARCTLVFLESDHASPPASLTAAGLGPGINALSTRSRGPNAC